MALNVSHNNDARMTVLSPGGGDFSEGVAEECYHFKAPFFETFVRFRSSFSIFFFAHGPILKFPQAQGRNLVNSLLWSLKNKITCPP